MLSNRRLETRKDYERRHTQDKVKRERSTKNDRQEANRLLDGRHWQQKNTRKHRKGTNKFKRPFLSRYQPITRTRRLRQPKLHFETYQASPLVSPSNSIYQVQVTSPQPPQKEAKLPKTQRFRDGIGVFSRTNSCSTDNLDVREDDNDSEFDDSSFSYYTDDEESAPRAHSREQYEGPQQNFRIVDTKEASNRFYQTLAKDSQPSTAAPKRLPMNTPRSPKPQGILFPFCCALDYCGNQPSLMSLSRKRIPGMTPREEQKLWKEAIHQHAINGSNCVADDPTIDRIEVVPVDPSFNAQGGFTYSEQEGMGMLFAPQSLTRTPESLPWWKRHGWTSTKEDHMADASIDYNRGCGSGNYCNFGKPTKTLLQQARDDIGVQRRPYGQKRESVGPEAKDLKSRRRVDQLRMGYHNGKMVTNGKSGGPTHASKAIYNAWSNSDLDESLDERVNRIDQLRGFRGNLETFDAKDGGGSMESEISLSLNVPHLNHDYKASHFELRAAHNCEPYVVEALQQNPDTKDGSSTSEQSFLPSGSDLSAVVNQKFDLQPKKCDESPRLILRQQRVQPISVIELHHIPTEDSSVPQVRRTQSGECFQGRTARTQQSIAHTRRDKAPKAEEPKHVIFVDEQIQDHDRLKKKRSLPASLRKPHETAIVDLVQPSRRHANIANHTNCGQPKTNLLAFQRKAPSPIKLYGDPPELRREDGSPVASPRSPRATSIRFATNDPDDIYHSNKALSTEDGEDGSLGKDLKQLLGGLSPGGTERPDGLIIFKPTINVIRSNEKSRSDFNQNERGCFVQQRTEDLLKTKNGGLPHGDVLSAEAEDKRGRGISLNANKSPLLKPPSEPFIETGEGVKTDTDGGTCWRDMAKPWFCSSGRHVNHLQGSTAYLSNRRERSQLQSDYAKRQTLGVSNVIDLSQYVNDSPTQGGTISENRAFPGAVSFQTQSPLSTPYHPEAESAFSEKLLDFVETETKPMIPLGLSINDYSSSSKHPVARTRDDMANAQVPENQQPKVSIADTDLSWKTVKDLYQLPSSGKSMESLEIVLKGPSTDEDDQSRWREDKEQRLSPNQQFVDDINQSKAVASLESKSVLGSGTISPNFAESISTNSNNSTLFDFDAIIGELEGATSEDNGSVTESYVSQARLRRSNHEKPSEIFGQKIYAELLRRGKLGLRRSSASKRKALEPIHEVPESKGGEAVQSKIEHRNAAVSRLRRLRKLQSKLHPRSDEGETVRSTMRTIKGMGPTTKLNPVSLKARLDARKKPTKGDSNLAEEPPSKPGSNDQRSNSLVEVYVQDLTKSPSPTTCFARWKADVASNRSLGLATPSSSTKMPKDKLVSSLSKGARARSVAAAKPGSLLWEAASKTKTGGK